ncbi:MAG: hypothetical protein ACLPTZ_11475 [Beijerinckiaceae bacterium]
MVYVVVTKLGDEKDYNVFARNTDAILHCATASTKPGFFFLHDDPGCKIFRVNTDDAHEAVALVEAGKGEPYEAFFEISIEDVEATLGKEQRGDPPPDQKT